MSRERSSGACIDSQTGSVAPLFPRRQNVSYALLFLCFGCQVAGGKPLLRLGPATPQSSAPSTVIDLSSTITEPQQDGKSSSSEDVTMLPTALAAYYWWFLIFYMFCIMSVICDDYLVPSIDVIVAKLQIPEDVAGATLMAFACNGPELLTNVSAIFVTDSEVGIGCIVGSAIFNVLVIVGACPIFAPSGKLHIPVQTFLRDTIFSAISIFILLWALPVVTLLHASVLLLMACVYVFVVYKTESWFGSYEVSNEEVQESLLETSYDPSPALNHEADQVSGIQLSKHNAVTRLLRKLFNWSFWALSFPTKALMWATIPDVRKGEQRHLHLVSFFSSMIWLSITSYVVVIGAKYIKQFWGIPESFLGLTLISIGTSWPNLVASVITAEQGRGPIAISNALGSNVQNVFLVLAVPLWFYCLLRGPYHMGSKDINSSILWMAATLGVVVLVTVWNNFKLVKCSGFIFFAVYLTYLGYAALIQ